MDVGDPHATPVPGVIGMSVPGANVVYGTADGSHLFAGDLYALGDTLVNLTERRRESVRKSFLSKFDSSTVVVFPAVEPRLALDVFVDVDCPFCRKLHADMDEINGAGIEVRYFAFPQAGLESPAYGRMVSAWCADDRHAAIDALMRGAEIVDRSCESAVGEHFALALKLGIDVTPSVVTPQGRLLMGYVSVSELITALDLGPADGDPAETTSRDREGAL